MLLTRWFTVAYCDSNRLLTPHKHIRSTQKNTIRSPEWLPAEFFFFSRTDWTWPTSTHASAAWAGDSSASDGCDSCFAAAWRTRSFTAVVEGDVGRPTLLGSIFFAANDNASVPTRTGDSNSLGKERTTCWTCNPNQLRQRTFWHKTGTKFRKKLTLGLAPNPRRSRM